MNKKNQIETTHLAFSEGPYVTGFCATFAFDRSDVDPSQ